MLRFAYAGESKSDRSRVVNDDGSEESDSGREDFDAPSDAGGLAGAMFASADSLSCCAILPRPKFS